MNTGADITLIAFFAILLICYLVDRKRNGKNKMTIKR